MSNEKGFGLPRSLYKELKAMNRGLKTTSPLSIHVTLSSLLEASFLQRLCIFIWYFLFSFPGGTLRPFSLPNSLL